MGDAGDWSMDVAALGELPLVELEQRAFELMTEHAVLVASDLPDESTLRANVLGQIGVWGTIYRRE